MTLMVMMIFLSERPTTTSTVAWDGRLICSLGRDFRGPNCLLSSKRAIEQHDALFYPEDIEHEIFMT